MKATTTTFEREDDESLMVIDVDINDSAILLAFDTGATHTVIDMTALLLMGISIPQNAEIGLLETAKGVVEAKMVEVAECCFCGIKRQNFKIHSYHYILPMAF